MQETQLMAGSGPGADEQVNPGVGGGGGSRSYQGFDDDEDYY